MTKTKFPLVNTEIFLMVLTLIFVSCSHPPKDRISQLIFKNDELNQAYSSKNWDLVLQYSEDARKSEIGWFPNEPKSDLLKKFNELFMEADMQFQRISIEYDGDTARVKNLVIARTNYESEVSQDTIYHVWVYYDNDWYLKNFMGWMPGSPSANKIDIDSIVQLIERKADSLYSTQEAKNIRLLKKNDDMNRAYSSKNWDLLFRFAEEAKMNRIIAFSLESKSDFKKKFSNFYFWADIKLKRISVEFNVDTATVKNLQIIRTTLDFKTYIDTVYHDWVYYDQNWYLRRLSYHKNYILPEPNPADEMQRKLDSIVQLIERKAASFNDSTQEKKTF